MKNNEYYRRAVWSIANIVAVYYGIRAYRLYDHNRHRPYAPARQMVWKIAREVYGSDLPFESLGNMFCRSHATIIQGVASITDQIDTDRVISSDYKKLLNLARIKLGLERNSPELELAKRLRGILGYSDMVNARVAIREIISTLRN